MRTYHECLVILSGVVCLEIQNVKEYNVIVSNKVLQFCHKITYKEQTTSETDLGSGKHIGLLSRGVPGSRVSIITFVWNFSWRSGFSVQFVRVKNAFNSKLVQLWNNMQRDYFLS